jgi:hypothetical protein
MLAETTTLIDEAIARLEMLRGVFADDFAVCRRAGLARDAHACGEAMEAIAQLLPKLVHARAAQEAVTGRWPGVCVHCD